MIGKRVSCSYYFSSLSIVFFVLPSLANKLPINMIMIIFLIPKFNNKNKLLSRIICSAVHSALDIVRGVR